MAPNSLSFSIPSLDDLFGSQNGGGGIPVPASPNTTSLCLIGPDGTGKSVFALHLARAYYDGLLTERRTDKVRVLYVSTDLKHHRALAVLTNFGKAYPAGQPTLIELPADGGNETFRKYLKASKAPPGIGFVDLAASTAGDDWGFVNRVLASLEEHVTGVPRHLVLIDAIEGLETMVGDHDAFGLESTRRQRVANLMRLAEKKAHIVLVVEEADAGKRNPEEFVADYVVRLRTSFAGNLTRRTVEIEKARALAGYAHGQHPFRIGKNGDADPGGLVEVFRALPSLQDTKDKSANSATTLRFGLKYLDEMLSGDGLRPGQVVAIVGEPSTLKSDLGAWFLAGAFEDKSPQGMAILLASRPDREASLLSAAETRGFSFDNKRVYCEHLPIADLPSSQVYWTIQRHLKRAIEQFEKQHTKKGNGRIDDKKEFVHRVVLDDVSSFRDVYPEIAQDSLFLPKLVGLLESQMLCNGSKSSARHFFAPVIIATQDGRPGVHPSDRFDQTLRNLMRLRIHTWHVEFYGQQRVAISTNTLARETDPVVVRELCWRKSGNNTQTQLFVDPHFELYRDLESGKPARVALEVRMFSETEAFDRYIRTENTLLDELFLPRNEDGHSSVITKVSPDQYEALRDLCNLRARTSSDHTLIIQVDEFWDPPPFTFRDERPYLRYPIIRSIKEGPDSAADSLEDPLSVFEPGESCRAEVTMRQHLAIASGDAETESSVAGGDLHSLARSDFFVLQGRTRGKGETDRVPFMWDYGFLLLDRHAWTDAKDRPLRGRTLSMAGTKDGPKGGETGRRITVGDVWRALRTPTERRPTISGNQKNASSNRKASRVLDITDSIKNNQVPITSWRVFLEAALEVARVARLGRTTAVHAFDASVISGESISSLVLEMWMSEIYLQERRGPSGRASGKIGGEEITPTTFANTLSAAPRGDWPKFSLTDLLHSRRRELYMVFLLLSEVLDFDNITEPDDPYTFRVRPGNEPSVASRHWYKTAALAEQTQFKDRASTPARLPGHFSVRGDWYLAVTSGSRSSRLANLGLDFLNARRANMTRLQMGLGLPVRDVCGINEYKGLRTALTYFSERPEGQDAGRRVNLPYWDLFAELGACAGWLREPLGRTKDEFNWLWRNRITGYGRHARIWENFILTMIRFWRRVRIDEGGGWVNGFDVYDRMYFGVAESAEGAATPPPGHTATSGTPWNFETLHSYHGFNWRVDQAVKEMNWVSRPKPAGASPAPQAGQAPPPSPA